MRLLDSLSNTMALQRNGKRARSLNEQALRIYRKIGDSSGEAGVLVSMAIRARKPRKCALLERALDLQRQVGGKKQIEHILTLLDWTCGPDELELRETYLRERLGLCMHGGSAILVAACLDGLAEIASQRSDEAGAASLKAKSLRIYLPPLEDPIAAEAFGDALTSCDMDGAVDALKKKWS